MPPTCTFGTKQPFQRTWITDGVWFGDQLAVFRPNFVQNCEFRFFVQNAKFRDFVRFSSKTNFLCHYAFPSPPRVIRHAVDAWYKRLGGHTHTQRDAKWHIHLLSSRKGINNTLTEKTHRDFGGAVTVVGSSWSRRRASSSCVAGSGGLSRGIDGSWMIGWVGCIRLALHLLVRLLQ